MCFGKPKVPQVPALPPAPTQNQAANVTASRQVAATERGAAALRTGRRSTVLTGPTGLKEEANIRRKTLLGE